MFKIENLVDLVTEYQKAHPPNTGYAINAAKAVRDAANAGRLPIGANTLTQFALQFDGAETGGDYVTWDGKEVQKPYGASFSLDAANDCMDFVRNLCMMATGRNPGNWTEGAYLENIDKQVPWSERRAGDLLLNKLSSRNKHATHAMLCLGGGLMLHTRSKSKPLMVTSDSLYSEKTRSGTGCFRIFTDDEYGAMTIGHFVEQPRFVLSRLLKRTKNFKKPWMSGVDVKYVQQALKDAGFFGGAVKGNYGPITYYAVRRFQKASKLEVDGVVGEQTVTALGGIWTGK